MSAETTADPETVWWEAGLPVETRNGPSCFSQGAQLTRDGVRYRTWTASLHPVVVVFDSSGNALRSLPMAPEGGGFFHATDRLGQPGDLYKYLLDGSGPWPDPASRYQPDGVHGASMVMDSTFAWTDQQWSSPALEDLVLYELHVGTFTEEGTFQAALGKLPYLAGLGVNAVELMPVADFPGQRNWGYDGVSLFAPARVYGRPSHLREFVNAAHAHGLAVFLDVVYNHLGPDGNYLGVFHKAYFHERHKTPWGAGLNFEFGPARAFFLQNVIYWMEEFHIDGFRLDATHAIIDESETHILAEIASVVHERGGLVIAENDRNDPRLFAAEGMGLDGGWADDFHHVVHVMLTSEQEGYYRNYEGKADELSVLLNGGWLCNERRPGDDPSGLSPAQLVHCLSNHDQVGNRAFGERLHHLVSPATYRAASALLCLSPYTPLLFMGQEWATTAPFQFFTDHAEPLGQAVAQGRRREFRGHAAFQGDAADSIPNPQSITTFLRAKLSWAELDRSPGREILRLYRECLRLRKTLPAVQLRSRGQWQAQTLDGIIAIIYGGASHGALLLVDLAGGNSLERRLPALLPERQPWRQLFSSNDPAFIGEEQRAANAPAAVLLGW